MTTVEINEIPKFLRQYIKHGLPVYIHGTMGIGKSMQIKETSRNTNTTTAKYTNACNKNCTSSESKY